MEIPTILDISLPMIVTFSYSKRLLQTFYDRCSVCQQELGEAIKYELIKNEDLVNILQYLIYKHTCYSAV